MIEKEAVINNLKELQAAEEALLVTISELELRIASRNSELKLLEENMLNAKNELMGLENEVVRNNERMNFNREKIQELNAAREYLNEQVIQLVKLKTEEEKLKGLRK